MRTIHAVFENGIFRPVEPVELPEGTPVDVLAPPVDADFPGPMSEGLAKIYSILGERYESGYTDTAERHDEHQP